MNVGIVGLGYWGPNLLRTFYCNPSVGSVSGCDLDPARLKALCRNYPSVRMTDTYMDLLKDPEIEAIAIALPVRLHYRFAKAALEAGKHCWIEKPFTASSAAACELIELAARKNLRIFVDHTYVYTGAVRKLREIVEKKELGDIFYFDSVRVNLGLFRHDVNVVWDLAPHDLSIMQYVLKKKAIAISSTGIANYDLHENIAHLSVYFENNCFAHFHINWTSPVKIRRVLIGGSKKMLVFDDMENFEKIKIYDSGVTIESDEHIHDTLIQYRTGDMYSPKVNQTEALALGVQEFLCAIAENRQPLTNGEDGLNIIRLLEASDRSMKEHGRLVEVG